MAYEYFDPRDISKENKSNNSKVAENTEEKDKPKYDVNILLQLLEEEYKKINEEVQNSILAGIKKK